MDHQLNPKYAVEFAALMAAQEIADPRVWTEAGTFDEVPIYSRYSELDFLDGLSVAEKNHELILAAVRLLDRIEQYFRAKGDDPDRFFRLVSVTDWWVDGEFGGGDCTDGTTGLLTPHLWIGNAEDERMKNFKVYPGRSPAASFVAGVVGTAYDVFEDELTEMDAWCPTRVYVCQAGQLPASVLGVSGN